MAKLTFLGAAGCVTGSKYLVEAAGKKLLVDCGLFQGTDDLKERNEDGVHGTGAAPGALEGAATLLMVFCPRK